MMNILRLPPFIGTPELGAVLSALILIIAPAVPAFGSEKAKHSDFTGTWHLNEELSENPRDKMREAMSNRGGGRRGGGRGGGGRGGFGGPGGGGPGGGGSFGGGRGGGRGSSDGADSASREDIREQMRAHEESFQMLEIIHQEPALHVQYGEDREEVIYTDGRAFERVVGRGELAEATAKWKRKERIVIKAEGERGKATETWEWVPDAQQLWLTVKMAGSGKMPDFEFRRVYDPVKAPDEETGGAELASGKVPEAEMSNPQQPAGL